MPCHFGVARAGERKSAQGKSRFRLLNYPLMLRIWGITALPVVGTWLPTRAHGDSRKP